MDTHTDLTVAEIRRVVLEDVQLRCVQEENVHAKRCLAYKLRM